MRTILLPLLAGVVFALPLDSARAEVEGLAYILGRWDTDTHFFEDEKWVSSGKTRATVDTKLGNSFYVMRTVVPFPGATFQFEITFSQDRFNGGYRASLLDDLNGYMDVYSGDLVDGVMTLDNVTTGTAFPGEQGEKVYGKIELSALGSGFQLMAYIRNGKGGEFVPYMRIQFSPAQQ